MQLSKGYKYHQQLILACLLHIRMKLVMWKIIQVKLILTLLRLLKIYLGLLKHYNNLHKSKILQWRRLFKSDLLILSKYNQIIILLLILFKFLRLNIYNKVPCHKIKYHSELLIKKEVACLCLLLDLLQKLGLVLQSH